MTCAWLTLRAPPLAKPPSLHFYVAKRFRSGAERRKPSGQQSLSRDADSHVTRPPYSFRTPQSGSPSDSPGSTAFLSDTTYSAAQFVKKFALRWAALHSVRDRFASFGVPRRDVVSMLNAFAVAAQKGHVASNSSKYQTWRLQSRFPSEGGLVYPADVALSNIFLLWATDPVNFVHFERNVQNSSVMQFSKVMKAAALKDPADLYQKTRRMKRHFVMHVGPTNSGKTHHALRALAAASTGCYAGPLRLLAHEIFERLNSGEIAPLGADMPPPTPVALAGDDPATPLRKGNPAWARLCNMVTGEEVKYVSPNASLVSCTVEMANLHADYDVAVIDEIQMIGNSHRGFAWTSAVLGLCASEIHLCGEDTAIPVVTKLLEHTGDTLEVRRYERLTPLAPMDTSLNRDWNNVQKGDCVVAFSRRDIFSVKEQIERQTGLRCALVYGKLPPEIRSEQAALFNDPNSGYDVLVGSDAVGMGLNLKIRRIVFSRVRKYDGTREALLSTSALKQIAGRAGRFGQHREGEEQVGGAVTTFYPRDLPIVRRALEHHNTSVTCARLSPSQASFQSVGHALHRHATVRAIFDAHMFASLVPPLFQFHEVPTIHTISDILDQEVATTSQQTSTNASETMHVPEPSSSLTLSEKLLLSMAPAPWREPGPSKIVANMVQQLRGNLVVDFKVACQADNLLERLDEIEKQMAVNELNESLVAELPAHLLMLETFHKIIVWYIWMAFRCPVPFCELEYVQETKVRAEVAMEWVLDTLSRHELGLPLDSVRSSSEIIDDPIPRRLSRAENIQKFGILDHNSTAPQRRRQAQTWFTSSDAQASQAASLKSQNESNSGP